jgi:hypothetical protein
MLRLLISVAIVMASTACHAFVIRHKEEPKQMRPGQTIHVFDRTCGDGYAKRVSVDEINGERMRKCVRVHYSPPEIVLDSPQK